MLAATITHTAWPLVSTDPSAQAHYDLARANGSSHALAEMLALRKFPGLRTDSTFNHGRCNGNQFEATPGLGDYYRGLAREAGVSTTGKFYCSGLASYPGDPAAWVSDRGDVLRVARAKGLRVHGDVSYDPGEQEPAPDVEIADEIVDAVTDDYMDMDPGERRADVREKVHGRLTGKVDNNPLLVEASPCGSSSSASGSA